MSAPIDPVDAAVAAVVVLTGLMMWLGLAGLTSLARRIDKLERKADGDG